MWDQDNNTVTIDGTPFPVVDMLDVHGELTDDTSKAACLIIQKGPECFVGAFIEPPTMN